MTPLIVLVLASVVTGSPFFSFDRVPTISNVLDRTENILNSIRPSLSSLTRNCPIIRLGNFGNGFSRQNIKPYNPRRTNNAPITSDSEVLDQTNSLDDSFKWSNPQETDNKPITSDSEVFQQTNTLVDSFELSNHQETDNEPITSDSDVLDQTNSHVDPFILSEPQETNNEPITSNSDVFQQTNSLVDSVIPSLRALTNDPSSAAIANKIIEDNYIACVSSLEEGIESATQLVENARPKITALTDKMKSFAQLREPAEIIKETGTLLRLMETLVKDSQFVDLNKCQAQGPAGGLTQVGGNGNTIPAFFSQLSSLRLKNFCSEGNFNRDSVTAIGDMMDIVAELYKSVGDDQTGEIIGKGKTFIERLTTQLEKIDFKALGASATDCREGDLTSAAETLEDIATLIEDTGIENLQEHLGVDLSFAFNLEPSVTVEANTELADVKTFLSVI